MKTINFLDYDLESKIIWKSTEFLLQVLQKTITNNFIPLLHNFIIPFQILFFSGSTLGIKKESKDV